MNCMAVALDPLTDRFTQFTRSSQRCRLQSLTNLDFNFLNFNTKQTNLTALTHRSVSTPCFSIAATNQEDAGSAAPRIEILGGRKVPIIRALVAEVTIAMVSGARPLLLPSGLGGAYLLQTGKGHSIAVAKPVDEEPLAFNNPKGSGGLMLGQPGLKRSIRVGDSGIRELAAYLLDHQSFSSVPPTALVRISHVPFHVTDSDATYKVASLQRFVGHDFDAGELGPGSFTVGSVHRIGILDVRVLNLDRHAGNMLVKKIHDQDQSCYNGVGAAKLVPIDHGLCLPECLDVPYFEWLNWPQASVPFTDTELQYISNIDPFKDAELIRTELRSIQESSIRVLMVCTIFLKQAAASGAVSCRDRREDDTGHLQRGREFQSVGDTLHQSKSKQEEEDDDDDYRSEWDEVEAELECCIFNFDDEFEDIQCKELPEMSQVSLFPRAPSLSANLSALMMCSWIGTHDKPTKNANDINREEDRKDRSMVRSKSHPICVNHDEIEGVFFGDMSADEWEMFLQIFQMLLPEALEGSTSKGPKPRFGSSCKF